VPRDDARTSTGTATVQPVLPTQTAASTPTPLSLATPRAVEQAPPPVGLRIPTLGIDTTVQWVGVDAEGRMGVPSNYTDVAWYERGPTPGTPGNAVIAGHLDSKTGPAVFYRLEDLKPGDEIFVTAANGQEYRFIVTASEVYVADDAPVDRIFGTAVTPHLNLITCDGAFDRAIRQYDKRLVVYSELKVDS
jgi:LPXTG-site transpeptidase (sortase) family protein